MFLLHNELEQLHSHVSTDILPLQVIHRPQLPLFFSFGYILEGFTCQNYKCLNFKIIIISPVISWSVFQIWSQLMLYSYVKLNEGNFTIKYVTGFEKIRLPRTIINI